ncbi:MAG: CsgG/HfaB family protein [Victivallaceae bacterium]|nr:CsgG/HfaB family protein [Victivallaceae bacterium]
MKKIILLGIVCCLSVMASVSHAEKMIISIGSFKNKTSAPSKMLNTLIDRITNGIVNTRKFNVIDNARLKETMTEHKKVDMGLSDAKGAPKKGKIKSAGYVLYGTVLALGAKAAVVRMSGVTGKRFTGSVELNIRFMDIESGELVASKTVKGSKIVSQLVSGAQASGGNQEEVAMQDAIQDASNKVVGKLMELAYPTKIIKVGKRNVTVNLPEERAKKGQLWHVFEVGETILDPDTGESLGADEELLGDIRIYRVGPKFAKAKPIGDLEIDDIEEGMIIRPVSDEEMEERQAKVKKQSVKRFRRRF